MKNRLAGVSSAKDRFYFWSAVVILLLLFAIIGPAFLKHDPFLVDLTQVNQPPSREYIMGTDYIGRCIFSRLVKGAARSIYAAVLVVIITFVIGTSIGVICGYFGGKLDSILMRVVDGVQSFPELVFTIG